MMTHSEIANTEVSPVTIRSLEDADRAAVELLAQRDTRLIPEQPLLGLELDGRLLAVTSLTDGRTIADPFSRTDELRAMLELRAAQLRRQNGRARGVEIRQHGRSRASLAGSPPGAGGRLLTLRP